MTDSTAYPATKEKVTEGKADWPTPPHKFGDVIAVWNTMPRPKHGLILYYTSNKKYDGDSDFDATFNYCYEITLGGWRYIVQAHVHVTFGGPGEQPKYSSGHTFVPGFKDQMFKTPDWVVAGAPTFDPATHKHDWSSNPAYRATLFSNVTGYRYPTKL
ncbi:hypothetical protein Rhe02_52750 [Rhizocola hellebori]|uniref:Uncharacterized protein n=1 Tax=Rhizocola hellebori TaxID=1392758 RepID=A0A8J3QCK0_9ACTN|nr:hypothetical protein [Rhizocola hellebori]GIH07208.1 hypothetical protein Rhe02_52750 [Rhizocola hellebori]